MSPTKAKQKYRKKKLIAELHLTYEMVYDPESIEFKEAFASFGNSISKGGTIEQMLVYVVHNVQLNGGPGLGGVHIDGVGWVSVRGLIPPNYKNQYVYSGIDFKKYPAKPDIDIISNDYI